MVRNLIILGLLTVITVLAWIGLDVYHNFTTSTITQDTIKTIVPITPTFDQEGISIVEKRQQLSVDLSGGPQATTGSAQRAKPTPSGSASSSAQINRVPPKPSTTLTP